jgi:hypothetical protein
MIALNEHKRRMNEKKFRTWEKLPVKEVDAMEQTIKFYQNIYDDTGMLVEVHEKYPDDKGHRKVQGD